MNSAIPSVASSLAPSLSVRRRLLLAAAVAAALLIAAAGSTSFLRKSSGFQPVGFEARQERGAWQVERVTSPRTGLLPDDRVLAVNQESPATGEALAAALKARGSSDLLVLRGDQLTTVRYRRPPLDIDFPYLVLALIGIGYLGIGLFTLLRDPRRPARLFFLWCLASGAVYVLTPAAPMDAAGRLLYVLEEAARLVLPPLTLHLFLVFPAPSGGARARRIRPFLYLPALALAVLQADLMLFDGRWLSGGEPATAIPLLDRIEIGHLALFATASLIVLAMRLRAERQPERRRQRLWLVAGVTGGYVPFLLLYGVPFLAGLRPVEWLTTLAVAPLALVPLAFAYAVLRYRLWDLGALARSTTSLAVTIFLGVGSFSLANLAISRAVPPDLPLTRQLAAFLTGLLIAAVMVPTRRGLAAGLERLQYGARFGKRKALAELGRELLHERDLDRLARRMVQRVEEALELDRVALLLARGESLVPLEGDADLPSPLSWQELDESLWNHPSSRLSGVSLPRADDSPALQLYRLGFRYLFPLVVRDRRIGVLLVSHREPDAPLSTDDLELLQSLCQQGALAIENALLLDEVQQRLVQVEQLQDYSRRLIESSPAGIAVVDGNGRVVSGNAAFSKLSGRSIAELQGAPLADCLPVADPPRPEEGLQEVRLAADDGERYLQLSSAWLDDSGERSQMLLIVQDVSDRVAMERAFQERERLAALGMLAAGVAHEVNTPITGISSYAQMLKARTESDDPRYPILEKVERQTFRASRIVNSLLELSRSRGQDSQPIAVAVVVDSALEAFEERLARQQVQLQWAPPRVSPQVLGQEGGLDQVVSNLVGNALDAMPDGGRLAIGLEVRDGTVRLTVEDTGVGMDTDQQQHIFEPFFTTRTGTGGTGLGLAISRQIVERMDGEIRVESEPGRGSRFTVELPGIESGDRGA